MNQRDQMNQINLSRESRTNNEIRFTFHEIRSLGDTLHVSLVPIDRYDPIS